jgi:anaphase-promoting complex subunit 5
MAEVDFKSLEIYRSVKDVQYLLSVIYHNLGMMRERDEVASRHSQTEEQQKRLESITFDPLYQNVFEVVAKVGAALASRK